MKEDEGKEQKKKEKKKKEEEKKKKKNKKKEMEEKKKKKKMMAMQVSSVPVGEWGYGSESKNPSKEHLIGEAEAFSRFVTRTSTKHAGSGRSTD